jgi:hypothetical protein
MFYSVVSEREEGTENWVVSDFCLLYSRIEGEDTKHAAELVAMIRDDYQDDHRIELTVAGRESVAARLRVRWTEQPSDPASFAWDAPLSDFETKVKELEY